MSIVKPSLPPNKRVNGNSTNIPSDTRYRKLETTRTASLFHRTLPAPLELFHLYPRLDRNEKNILITQICRSKQIELFKQLLNEHSILASRLLEESFSIHDDDPKGIDIIRNIFSEAIHENLLIDLISRGQLKPNKLGAILKFPQIKYISKKTIEAQFTKWLEQFPYKEVPINQAFIESIYLLFKTFPPMKSRLNEILLTAALNPDNLNGEFKRKQIVLILSILMREIKDLIAQARAIPDRSALKKLRSLESNYSTAIKVWECPDSEPQLEKSSLALLIEILQNPSLV